jgi:prevent-host-death family protein
MKTVAAAEAASRFAEILSAVEHGEDYVITRGGEPIARLIAARSPAEDQTDANVSSLIGRIKALCESGKPGGFDLREAVEEGRN